jgi:Fe-S cluster assembly iron-binding protein IscA
MTTMFNITDEAQIYVADLFAQQDEEGLGLKVDIEKAGILLVLSVIFLRVFASNNSK